MNTNINLSKINRYKRYPANVEVFTDDGVVSLDICTGDFSGATWTDDEAMNDARDVLRNHGLDDSTADDFLVRIIAGQFPRKS